MSAKHRPQDEPVNINELPQQRAAEYISTYSNHVEMGFSLWDFRILFFEITEDEKGDIIREKKARVAMSPQHAMAFSQLLNSTIEMWTKERTAERRDGQPKLGV